MIVVRYVFHVKWGSIDEVASVFKSQISLFERILGGKHNVRLMTDLTGTFFTLVEEIDFKSVEEWEELRPKIFADPEFQKSMASISHLIESGSTELYTLV